MERHSTLKKNPLMSALSLIFLLALAGCARIADPQPPRHQIPSPSHDLSLRQIADTVVLTVSMPAWNTDGSPATTLRNVEVFRLTENSVDAELITEEWFLEKAEHIMSIQSPNFAAYMDNNTFIMEDNPPFPPEPADVRSYTYAVVFVNNRRQAAGIGNRATITPVPIPPPPADLDAVVEEHAIRLTWSPPSENMDGSKPARIAGYTVYRSEHPDPATLVPINTVPLQQAEFADRDFRFSRTYYYSVGTIGRTGPPMAESLPSSTVSITALDVFPPMPPDDFNAVYQGDVVLLLWTPSSSPDAAGYRIYRRDLTGAVRKLLGEVTATSLSYRDDGVEKNRSYEYLISTVDARGNESTAVRTEVDVR
jgi:hypothetical protein